jgi:hypothetical protein
MLTSLSLKHLEALRKYLAHAEGGTHAFTLRFVLMKVTLDEQFASTSTERCRLHWGLSVQMRKQ